MTDSQPSAQTLLSASLLFGVLGKLLNREATREELDQLLAAQTFTELPFGDEQPESQAALRLLGAWMAAHADGLSQDSYDAVRQDYFYLFAGVGRPLASPWESVYFNEGRLMFEKQTLEVRDWYVRFGLEIANKNREPDDSVGYELSFIAHLTELAAEALTDVKPDEAEKALQALRGFLVEHPLRWIPLWAQSVEEHAKTDFYKGLALLVVGALGALGDELRIDPQAVQRAQG